MRAHFPGVFSGEVWHRRNHPTFHEFVYPCSQVWIDPDDGEAITSLSPVWSSKHRVYPASILRGDYGMTSSGNVNEHLRKEAKDVLGYAPTGAVRMLSQPRRFGWLFNPITVFLLWHEDPESPAAVIAEVTNTPWKERIHYALALTPVEASTPEATKFATSFDKEMHVSPFLEMDYEYRLSIESSRPDGVETIAVRIEVWGRDDADAVVETEMIVRAQPTNTDSLLRSAFVDGWRTRQVSAGIHAQAAKLAAKRVRFVSHPK